jgi:trehalose 6-phosphate synthase
MRLSLRFVIPLILVADGLRLRGRAADRPTDPEVVRARPRHPLATLIANTIQRAACRNNWRPGKKAKIGDFFARITQDERLYAIGYCATRTVRGLSSPARRKSAARTSTRWRPGDHLLASKPGAAARRGAADGERAEPDRKAGPGA